MFKFLRFSAFLLSFCHEQGGERGGEGGEEEEEGGGGGGGGGGEEEGGGGGGREVGEGGERGGGERDPSERIVSIANLRRINNETDKSRKPARAGSFAPPRRGSAHILLSRLSEPAPKNSALF